MSITIWRIVGAGLFFLAVFLSGFWLNKSGKPYNTILLTAHKLIALATAVFFIITILQINRMAHLSVSVLIASVVTVAFFIDAIVSGGLLSASRTRSRIFLTMHQIMPYLTVLSTAVTLYLIYRSN